MNLVTPQAFSKRSSSRWPRRKSELHASEVTLLKGSPLNVRVGGCGDAGFVQDDDQHAAEAEDQGPMSPFEEAQW